MQSVIPFHDLQVNNEHYEIHVSYQAFVNANYEI